MKIAFAIILAIILVVIGLQIFSFLGEERALNQNLSDVELRLTQAKAQEADLQDEMQYLANPTNLEKELRVRFNYKKPGETMIIIVPSGTSTTP
jgi:hypothetical protein